MLFYSGKEGTTSQNEDFVIPRHGNVKKPTAAYYKINIQTISKARTILRKNFSFSSIHNEVNHEAKISVAEEIRNPKQLWNLKNNLNKAKRESSSNSEEVDRIVMAMKLEHGKSFIRNVTILPKCYVVFAFTDDWLEGVERCCVNSSSVFRFDTKFEIIDNTALTKTQGTKGPEFRGHMMMHFRKDQGTYRRRATKIVTAKTNLSNISMIGHDMDQAIKNGLTIIFSRI